MFAFSAIDAPNEKAPTEKPPANGGAEFVSRAVAGKHQVYTRGEGPVEVKGLHVLAVGNATDTGAIAPAGKQYVYAWGEGRVEVERRRAIGSRSHGVETTEHRNLLRQLWVKLVWR